MSMRRQQPTVAALANARDKHTTAFHEDENQVTISIAHAHSGDTARYVDCGWGRFMVRGYSYV